ncbi:MAG: hypothetical protein AB7G34_07775 [Hyphomicrobiales bacterium]
MDMRLPDWIRVVVLASTLMQLVFGLTLFYDPSRIADVWPWPLPPLSARILGASTLVSVPLALFALHVNRFGAAMIPFVMMATYRVLQLVAGIIHIDRFKGGTMTTLNYFGGGFMMLAIFLWVLWAGSRGKLPRAREGAPLGAPMPWKPKPDLRPALSLLAFVYAALGVAFLVMGGGAAGFWIDAGGLTPLTARLFASPLIGLGLGLWLVSRSRDWRRAAIPATGMLTIGFAVSAAMLLGLDKVALPTPVAWLVAATPALLFAIGAWILLSRPAAAARQR